MKTWDIGKRFISRKSNAPFYLTFFVTARCNAKCSHCFYWKEISSANAKKELSLDEINRFTRTMGNVYFLSLTGGEPFLRKDLAGIVSLFVKNNNTSHVLVPTNGMLSDEAVKFAKTLLEKHPKLSISINISLDGPEQVHDKIRGVKGCFKKAISTYRALEPLKNSHKNLNVRFAATLSAANHHIIREFYDFVKSELNAELTIILLRGTPRNAQVKGVDIRAYDEIQDIIFREDKWNGRKLTVGNCINYSAFRNIIRFRMSWIREKLISDTFRKNEFIIPCFAAKTNAVIYETGDVMPCELLDLSLGNLRDMNYDFQKIWNSADADKARRWIKDSKCFCTHECNMTSNVLFNPKLLLKILKGNL